MTVLYNLWMDSENLYPFSDAKTKEEAAREIILEVEQFDLWDCLYDAYWDFHDYHDDLEDEANASLDAIEAGLGEGGWLLEFAAKWIVDNGMRRTYVCQNEDHHFIDEETVPYGHCYGEIGDSYDPCDMVYGWCPTSSVTKFARYILATHLRASRIATGCSVTSSTSATLSSRSPRRSN